MASWGRRSAGCNCAFGAIHNLWHEQGDLSERGRGEIGRRSRLQSECPRGNPWSRTAQSRGKLRGHLSQSRAKPSSREGVETRRAAPTAIELGRRDSPDHERQSGGGESRSGTKICSSKGGAGSSPAVRTSNGGHWAAKQNLRSLVSRVWAVIRTRCGY